MLWYISLVGLHWCFNRVLLKPKRMIDQGLLLRTNPIRFYYSENNCWWRHTCAESRSITCWTVTLISSQVSFGKVDSSRYQFICRFLRFRISENFCKRLRTCVKYLKQEQNWKKVFSKMKGFVAFSLFSLLLKTSSHSNLSSLKPFC